MLSLLFIYVYIFSPISRIVSHTQFLLQFCSVEGLLCVSHAKGQMMEASTSLSFHCYLMLVLPVFPFELFCFPELLGNNCTNEGLY